MKWLPAPHPAMHCSHAAVPERNSERIAKEELLSRYPMKKLWIVLIVTVLSGCATGPGPVDPKTGMTQAQRNLCEATRSFEPYRPGQCGGA
ncbi:hypothetical protein D3870_21790 [Noviherbaspirillum cavernae]|uniref:Uncharacterized protein n=2 Tax=Noviherbaspirillum cavernae TaxID=2320862 RepID=A0A418WWF6_9BURK|nr:hypothetical protein D3870_21790 [Noviherbaspirillum cavernae]